MENQEYMVPWTSLVVQCLRLHASTAGGPGLIPGWGTKILHAPQYGKKKKKKEYRIPEGCDSAHFTLPRTSPAACLCGEWKRQPD